MQTENTVQETSKTEVPPSVTVELRDGKEVYVAHPSTRLLTTAEQEEMEALSLEVFGATSKWATILKKGFVEPVTETQTEFVPEEKDEQGNVVKAEETREVQVPVFYRSPKKGLTNIPTLRTRRFTVEELKVFMLNLREKQRKIKEMLEKMAEDRRKAEEQKKLEQEVGAAASGSVK